MLQEATPHIDSVEMHGYKYYKFTLLESNDENIQNVTFELTPLHGDCDLYLSHWSAENDSELIFPNKTSHEKKSQRIGELTDHVTYDRQSTNAVIALPPSVSSS
jgi:hypothetical protein